jgi:hypothetical protein
MTGKGKRIRAVSAAFPRLWSGSRSELAGASIIRNNWLLNRTGQR